MPMPLQPRATSVALDGRYASLARQGSSSMTVSGTSAAAATTSSTVVRPIASASRSVEGAVGAVPAVLAWSSVASASLLLALTGCVGFLRQRHSW